MKRFAQTITSWIPVLMLLTAGFLLGGCGADSKPQATATPPQAETVSGGAVSGQAIQLSEDQILERAQEITKRISLDDKIELMVVGYADISKMPRFFPGDSTVPVSNDGSIPEVDDSLMQIRERMNEIYAEPIGNGTDRIMMSTAAYPKISAMITSAFLSYEMVSSLLRTEMNYQGVIYTPPLSDPCLRKRYPGDTDGFFAVEAVKAGCDVLYQPIDKKRAKQALRIEVTTGNMSLDRIDVSVVRILSSKIRHGETIKIKDKFY